MDTKRVKMVDITSRQIKDSAQQVVNAAEIVSANPNSKAAQEHLILLKNNWGHRVELLRATVAGMTEPGKVVIVDSESVEKAMAAARQAAMDGDDEVEQGRERGGDKLCESSAGG